jgi:3'-phosphoadenosine 5'-phosphosulfate sulfotransferase (PAPS reductase)/FAD synthetase
VFRNLQKQAERLEGEPTAVLFSGGKDAIVAADLWRKRHKDNTFVFLYFVPGLSFVESILRYYERLWKIKIHRRPCDIALGLTAQKLNLKKQQFRGILAERMALESLGLTWAVTGIKKNDSLARRGMFKSLQYGIDEQGHKVHPLGDWSDRQVLAYCRLNKLPLSVTYGYGASRSIWVPNTQVLIWIRTQWPKDYARIIEYYPQLENAVFRMEERLRR